MTSLKTFVHLKVKSHYSILEGSMKILDIVSEAKKNKMPAVALTDKGNVFGAMEFTKTCLDFGIQPILGCVLNIDISRLVNSTNFKNITIEVTLLVQNEIGWKNLSYLISKAYFNLKNNKANYVDLEEFLDLNKGLICLFNDINENELTNKLYEESYTTLLVKFKKVFGSRFYLDLFRDKSLSLIKKEAYILDISEKFDIPLACTNNISFLNSDIYEAHDCLNCISQNTTLENPNRVKPNPEAFFKDSNEMQNIFFDKPEAIINTINIARRCSFLLEEQLPKLPNIYAGDKDDEIAVLKKLASEGLVKRLNIKGINKQDKTSLNYLNRLEYELRIISEMGYAGYFLIVSDFISWAKKNNIPVGPGRGSGAGSIVAWSLNITNLDPIKYGLLFERFLNPERVSLPDFDIDFCTLRRDEVISYVRQKYGEEKVAQIITFGRLQPKAVIRDVGRVLGINYGVVDKLAKTIPNLIQENENLEEIYKKNLAMQNIIDGDSELEKLYEISVKLQGLNRNASTHAAGLVISNSPIKNDVPLYYDLMSEIPATQFSMKFLEKIGLIKFDFLGVETLTVIDKTLKLLAKRKIVLDIDKIDLKDSLTFKNLSLGYTLGVFQLESIPMRNILKELQPDRIEDIIAVVALYRPGPMENIPSYIKRKHNNKLTTYQHQLLMPVLEETYGIMIYQEQVMEAAQVLAGFSLAKADILRRAIGKKIKSEMDDLKESFVNGCNENNISVSDAKKIFSDIEKFAGYGFNKSHAAAYAIISYQTAWLKSNFPVEYFTSLLNSEAGKTGDKPIHIMVELIRLNIKLLPCDINLSKAKFSVEEYNGKLCIRSGLSNIKNIGTELAKFIVTERNNNGLYKSIIDFFSRMDDKLINKRQVEFLSMAGVFDSFKERRSVIFNSASNLIGISQNSQKDRETNQQNLFGSDVNKSNISLILKKVDSWNKKISLRNEYLSLGFFITELPISMVRPSYKKFNLSNSLSIIESKVNGKIFELLGFLIKKEEKTINNKKAIELLFLDEWGTFNLAIFEDNSFSEISIEVGEIYLITVINSVDNERRMRLRLKTIRLASEYINKPYLNIKNIKIHIEDLRQIAQLKSKLSSIEEGENKVILVYSGYEVDTGIKLNTDRFPISEINLLEGIKIL